MKITYGIIVYNGAAFLKQLLESIYPHAHAICIAEGPVQYYANRGITQSDDGTIEILQSFPDPDRKMHIIHGQWSEKDNMCQAWFNMVPADTDYVWCQDADELFTEENIWKVKNFLNDYKPTTLGFKSDTFFGGEFTRVIGGFERDHSFTRVLRYIPGCYYARHRQPTLAINGADIIGLDISGSELYGITGVTMWHGSYVMPHDVKRKIEYYRNAVIAPGKCIPNYFEELWLPWVREPEKREAIERMWKGVQEFTPDARGECYTEPFIGTHPKVILRDMDQLKEKFNKQLAEYA